MGTMLCTFSRMLATANSVEGETSSSLFLMEVNSWSEVMLRPSFTSQKRSVLAVHRIITYTMETCQSLTIGTLCIIIIRQF